MFLSTIITHKISRNLLKAFVQENQPGPPPIGPHPRPTLGPRSLRRGMDTLIQHARRHIQRGRNVSRPTTPESQQLPPSVTPRTRRRAEVRLNNPLETPTRRRVPRPRNNSTEPPETPTRRRVPPSNSPEPPETPEPPSVTPRTRRRAEVRRNNPLETPTRRRVPPSRNNSPEPPETPIQRRVASPQNDSPQPHQDQPRQRRKVGPRRMIAREPINPEENVTHSLSPFDAVYVLYLFMHLL